MLIQLEKLADSTDLREVVDELARAIRTSAFPVDRIAIGLLAKQYTGLADSHEFTKQIQDALDRATGEG